MIPDGARLWVAKPGNPHEASFVLLGYEIIIYYMAALMIDNTLICCFICLLTVQLGLFVIAVHCSNSVHELFCLLFHTTGIRARHCQPAWLQAVLRSQNCPLHFLMCLVLKRAL